MGGIGTPRGKRKGKGTEQAPFGLPRLDVLSACKKGIFVTNIMVVMTRTSTRWNTLSNLSSLIDSVSPVSLGYYLIDNAFATHKA